MEEIILKENRCDWNLLECLSCLSSEINRIFKKRGGYCRGLDLRLGLIGTGDDQMIRAVYNHS